MGGKCCAVIAQYRKQPYTAGRTRATGNFTNRTPLWGWTLPGRPCLHPSGCKQHELAASSHSQKSHWCSWDFAVRYTMSGHKQVQGCNRGPATWHAGTGHQEKAGEREKGEESADLLALHHERIHAKHKCTPRTHTGEANSKRTIQGANNKHTRGGAAT